MDTKQIIANIESQLHGLLYITETEHTFDVLHWEGLDSSRLQQQIAAYSFSSTPVSRLDAGSFFEHLAHNAEASGDEVAIADAPRYRALYKLLQQNFTNIEMWKTGHINTHIFITCQYDSGYIVLHTQGVES